MTPDELKTMIEYGMTEDAMNSFSSVNKVYLEMTDIPDAIDALTALTDDTGEEPYNIA